ncbi:MAG: cupin domain-containing protein [Sphingomonadaceae bacterium]|nr:cupin domain-containing protein [Sphingomonadaceae bacterium]
MTNIVRVDDVAEATGSRYPPPHDAPCAARAVRRLGLAVGVEQFGVNLCRLPPGAHASLRHAHSHEDEVVLMLTGELALVDNAGERIVRAGDVMGHPAGNGDAHTLVNRSDADATFLAIGSRSADDVATYPDIGMMTSPGRYAGGGYRRADGAPWPGT